MVANNISIAANTVTLYTVYYKTLPELRTAFLSVHGLTIRYCLSLEALLRK